MRKARAAAAFAVSRVTLCFLLFLACEGLATTLLVAMELLENKPVAEKVHTVFDPDLGWVNRANVRIANMYGPHKSLTINAQGFRGLQDVSAVAPADKLRIVCSGDSFTLGYGVADADTWCNRLALLDPHLQTINMGQGGYGADQAYLWYRRDGARLQPAVHLFAFISGDFQRMQSRTLMGYGKPILELQNGALRVANVPVPEQNRLGLWFARNRETFGHFGLVQLFKRFSGRWELHNETPEITDDLCGIVAHMFDDLQHLDREENSTLVLVHLPTEADYADGDSLPWERFLQTEAQAHGWMYVDLIPELRRLDAADVPALFISQGAIGYLKAEGHYSEAGNRFIATTLHRRLRSLLQSTIQLDADGGRELIAEKKAWP